jgi:hypothetical protein
LRSGRAAEAVEQLAGAATDGLLPVLWSLRGAAFWLMGQEALRKRAARDAARQFEAAAGAFVSAAEWAATARQALPERLAATYVGQSIAMVVAEQFGGAIQLFARRQRQGMAATPALGQLARDLFQFCELAPQLAPEERRSAGDSLRPILDAVMTVALWDGSQPVQIRWDGLGASSHATRAAS